MPDPSSDGVDVHTQKNVINQRMIGRMQEMVESPGIYKVTRLLKTTERTIVPGLKILPTKLRPRMLIFGSQVERNPRQTKQVNSGG